MIRDLTAEFLPENKLLFPVKVFHEFFQPSADFQKGSIVFILDPKGIKQDELMYLLKYDACFVLFCGSHKALSYESHPVRLLLHDRNADSHLEHRRDVYSKAPPVGRAGYHNIIQAALQHPRHRLLLY